MAGRLIAAKSTGVEAKAAPRFISTELTAAVTEKNRAYFIPESFLILLGEATTDNPKNNKAIPRYSLTASLSPKTAKAIKGTHTSRKRDTMLATDSSVKLCILAKEYIAAISVTPKAASQKNAAGLSSSLKLNQAKALKAASRITSNHQPKAVGSSSFKAFLVTKKARFDKNPPANAITTHVGIAILSF